MLFLQVGAKGAIDKTSKAADSGVSCSGAVGGEVSISIEYCPRSGDYVTSSIIIILRS